MLDLKFIRDNIDLVQQEVANPRGNPLPPAQGEKGGKA